MDVIASHRELPRRGNLYDRLLRKNTRNDKIADMEPKQYYVYLMTNYNNTVIYIGVTNNIVRRVYEHKSKLIKGFTKKYNINKLVYFELFSDIKEAIAREKQIKAGSRQKKIDLIIKENPEFNDLYPTII